MIDWENYITTAYSKFILDRTYLYNETLLRLRKMKTTLLKWPLLYSYNFFIVR